jgi:hypothetical protein
MSVAGIKPDYEEVFTVTEYYDGPRQGVANFKGQPHFYDCIFDDKRSDYSNLYRLTPISPRIFDLAKEDWAIWERWESAFHAGKTTRETHPALPNERARYDEIRAVLDSALRTDNTSCVIQTGLFEESRLSPLQVRWTSPKPQDD